MAPKKQHPNQQRKPGSKASSKAKPSSSTSDSKPAPKLQISAENERRLRRLLLNNERPAVSPTPAAAGDDESRDRKAKRLRNVYDKLSLEGFSADQIELALSSLNEGATYEAALDWLCLNITGNELPIKFSTGVSSSIHEERTIKIISTARSDWVSKQVPLDELRDDMSGASVRIKGRRDEEFTELGKSSQAEWIRRYLEREDDEEDEKEEADPSSRAAAIAKEYTNARLQALLAKQKKDRKNQDYYGEIIRKLKKEASSLGLPDDILETRFEDDNATQTREVLFDSLSSAPLESDIPGATGNWSDISGPGTEPVAELNVEERSSLKETEHSVYPPGNPGVERDNEKNEEPEDLELDNLFAEDSSSVAALPSESLKQQKKDKFREHAYGYALGNIDDIWKKGDVRRIPKAVLQKLCQKLGWEAPKYNKIAEKEKKFLYSVGILRTATGRGKSRKAGGLLILQLPEQFEDFGSVEDAQNNIAAFALSRLFHDLPLCQMLMEPYSSLVSKWLEDGQSKKLEERENTRRADFVESLLNVDASQPMTDLDDASVSALEKSPKSHNVEKEDPDYYTEGTPLTHAGSSIREQVESSSLRKLLASKLKLPKYQDMLKARAALPITKLKNQFLQLLNENDVMVISGETGCGKTTQVPQFILDDMIESGRGGYCNIMCTQPRRIAAISVAERVSDERSEPPPGCHGSLVGFQVRLDSARNENTKLLFCTTGILLRKLAGNKDLAGITHVIVDEVHERSLLGDFLLIVLKQLINKQSGHRRSKLKVILMSATVDATLFSRYFGNCPVIHAEGRTHPVSTCFLEDVYEMLDYSLPSDSPASGIHMPTSRTKPAVGSVDNHRGKKNLVLSAWGDDSQLSEDYINPDYIPSSYESYNERTRKNLKNLVEDVIDYDLLEDLVCYIDEVYPPGAILIFLPGVAEINSLIDRLVVSYQFRGLSDWILPLHSSLAAADQKRVFLSPPPDIRKVIVATDVAETSITIDDVTYVIDTGKHKESRYNPQKKMSSMVEDWISQANANQRRGRAGRVKPGICFCLYTHHRLEKLMRPFQVPEMLRMPLTELCLHIKSLSLGAINSFLMEAIEPPREEAISSAIDLLVKVGALEGDEELSPLGYHLAKLPVDVLIGKMMLYGAIFGCLSPVLSTAAFLSYKTPFVSTKDEKQNLERAKAALLSDNNLDNGTASGEAYGHSDHLLMVLAYNRWAKILCKDGAKAAYQFCRSFFLNSSVMYMIRDMRIQFGSLLADIGIVDLPKSFLGDAKRKDKLDSWFADMSRPFNMYSHQPCIIKSIICAGLYPNVAATIEGIFGVTLGCNKAHTSHPGKDQPLWHDGRREVYIHPTSTNSNVEVFRYPFLVFLEKVETSKVFLRDTSMVSPYSILLFGGSISIQHQAGLVIVDGWLKLNSPAQVAVLFKELRLTLHAVLKKLISKPEMAKIADNEVVRSIVHLLLEEDKVR